MEQVFEEQIDEAYEPSAAEVEEYARWLGLDPAADGGLLWVAREALKAPLPEEWKPCRSPEDGRLYYFNFVTGRSSWQHPCDEYYKQLAESEKRKRSQPAPPAAAAPKQQLFAGPTRGSAAAAAAAPAPGLASLLLRPAAAPSSPPAAGPGSGAFGGAHSPLRPSTSHGPSWQASSAAALHSPVVGHQAPQQSPLPGRGASPLLGAGASLGSSSTEGSGGGSWGPGGAEIHSPAPRRLSEPSGLRPSLAAGVSGPLAPSLAGRKPSTAPAPGPKKVVTWQDLVSTDPQPTAQLPPPKPAPTATARLRAFGPPASAVPGGSGSIGGGRSSYAQQVKVFKAKMAAAAGAAGTVAAVPGGGAPGADAADAKDKGGSSSDDEAAADSSEEPSSLGYAKGAEPGAAADSEAGNSPGGSAGPSNSGAGQLAGEGSRNETDGLEAAGTCISLEPEPSPQPQVQAKEGAFSHEGQAAAASPPSDTVQGAPCPAASSSLGALQAVHVAEHRSSAQEALPANGSTTAFGGLSSSSGDESRSSPAKPAGAQGISQPSAANPAAEPQPNATAAAASWAPAPSHELSTGSVPAQAQSWSSKGQVDSPMAELAKKQVSQRTAAELAQQQQLVEGQGAAAQLEDHFAAEAGATLAKQGHTELLKARARQQAEQAAQAQHELQLRLEGRHLEAMRASLRSMKENLQEIQRLGQQGEQLMLAAGLQGGEGAAGCSKRSPAPGGSAAVGSRGSAIAAATLGQPDQDTEVEQMESKCLAQLRQALAALAGP